MTTDGLYFLYVDEIYAPNVNNFLRLDRPTIFSHLNHFHFGLGGVVLPASILPGLNMSLKRLQHKFYPSQGDQIFHYVDMLHKRNLFSDLNKNKRKRTSLIDSLKYWVNQAEFKFLAAFIDNHELIKQFGTFDNNGRLVNVNKIPGNIYPKSPALNYNLYSLALKFLLKEFYAYLSSKKYPARGIIVAEARGEAEDLTLRETFYQYQCTSIANIKSHEFRQTIVELFIIYKKQNHAGLQLADMLLYPTYDATVPFHSIRKDHIFEYSKLIRPKLLNKTAISIFPK